MEKVKVAILGFGSRGYTYANIIMEHVDEVELVAVCEKNPEKKPLIQSIYGIKEENYFANDAVFFAQGKIADILIIATMDQDHHQQAITALELEYDLLLEKPIATTKQECIDILEKSQSLNRKVAVCHVLRYTAFYQKLKEIIESDKIGEVATLSQTEHVGYFHYAHSYVRGNWRNELMSAPMILAKSCHDLDIIKWLIGKKCEYITSFGSLSYFKRENAPEDSADFCYQCESDCPYNAIKFYQENPMWMMVFSLDNDVKRVLSNENLTYSKCVYKLDNDVVDHQVVNMMFEDGVTAAFTMTAFSNETHRSIKIHGTKGEIEADLEGKTILVKVFGKNQELIDVNTLTNDFSGHQGGDKKMLMDFVRNVKSGKALSGLTDIKYSLESHFMALDAEASRINNGKVIKLN